MKCHPFLLPSPFLCTEVVYGSSCFTPGLGAWQIFNLFGNNCSNNDYFIGFNYVLKKCCSSDAPGKGEGDEMLRGGGGFKPSGLNMWGMWTGGSTWPQVEHEMDSHVPN